MENLTAEERVSVKLQDSSSSNSMLACPLCGCDDLETSPWPANRERTEWVSRCGNPDCGCEVRGATSEEVAAKWNRRATVEPSSVAVNEPVFYRCETCKEIMLAAHLVGTDSHERIEETSEGQPYQVTCGPVRPSVLSAGEYINRFLPANWMNDSSLETWFPITAEELKRLKDERAAQPPSAGRALDREDLIIPATRYYMGRRTIGVTAHCHALARAWPDLSRNVQDIIRRDLEEEFRRDDAMRADEKCSRSYYPLGDDCDREAWEMVRAAWGAVTKDDGLWNPFGNDGMRHMENADVIGGATDETKGGGQP